MYVRTDLGAAQPKVHSQKKIARKWVCFREEEGGEREGKREREREESDLSPKKGKKSKSFKRELKADQLERTDRIAFSAVRGGQLQWEMFQESRVHFSISISS